MQMTPTRDLRYVDDVQVVGGLVPTQDDGVLDPGGPATASCQRARPSSFRACVPHSAARTCRVGQLLSRAWPRAHVAESAASAASHNGEDPLKARALQGSTDDQLPFDHTLKLQYHYHSDTSIPETNVARAYKKRACLGEPGRGTYLRKRPA
jgi:hypothetical protein